MKMKGWFWNIAFRIVKREIDKRFDYSFDELDLGNLKGPLFIVTNHVCAWDPFFVAMAFHDRQIAFVASEHILRMPRVGKIVEKYTDVIPHKKAGGGTRSTIECLKRLKNGESIFIASEGEQTWDGISRSAVPSTGKLLKKSGAAVVTLRIEGGYLAMPRWADNIRRGKVHLKHVNTYSAEVIAAMAPEEIRDTINRDLYLDIWEWQRAAAAHDDVAGAAGGDGAAAARDAVGMNKYVPQKGGLADGIERLLSMCPSCKRMGTLTSRGDEVSCDCGFKTAVMDTGFFDPTEPFETIAEWNAWQESELDAVLDSGAHVDGDAHADGGAGEGPEKYEEIFGDSAVALVEIENGHDEKEIAAGRLSLVRDGGEIYMTVGACSAEGDAANTGGGPAGVRFALADIDSMTMILYNRIVFSANDVYYEIRPDDMKGRMNLRKYIVAWQKRGGGEE